MLTVATLVPPAASVIFSPASTTANENPNGFLYVANVSFELASGANASLCSFITISKSSIVIESMIVNF